MNKIITLWINFENYFQLFINEIVWIIYFLAKSISNFLSFDFFSLAICSNVLGLNIF